MITLRYLFRWICEVVTQLSVLIVVLSPSRERRQSILSKTRKRLRVTSSQFLFTISINAESNMKVTRTKEMVTKQRIS